jgi:MinD superfamily P-loop ATPase
MKELLVISGKGGTGKTTMVGAFAGLANDTPLTKDTVLVDCDVDAADLHLILKPSITEKKEFFGLKKANLDPAKCNNCGACAGVCRFGAIASHDGIVKIESISCEGCKVCYRVCPNQAISMEDVIAGHWFISDTPYGPMVHARLGIAEENSGKLVMEVRREAKRIAEILGSRLIISDGPPGIGCPVISSMSGVDLALIVTEPTIAGVHDMERLHSLADGFDVEVVVCINKHDLDYHVSAGIEEFCYTHGIDIVGRVPFDEEVVKALARGEPIISPGSTCRESKSPAARATEQVWAEVVERLS